MIRRAPNLVDRPQSKAETKHLAMHRLDLLWQDLKHIMDTIKEPNWGKPDAVDIEGIDHYISQLYELDPNSYHLRYPRSKKEAPNFKPNLNINLRHFAEMMERLADCFETLDMATYVLEEQRVEMKVELARWRGE